MTELPEYEEITYAELKQGDVILPWNVEDIWLNGTWTVTLIGPVPLRDQIEYQTDRTGWTRVTASDHVRVRRRLLPHELERLVRDPAGTVVADPVL